MIENEEYETEKKKKKTVWSGLRIILTFIFRSK